MRQAAGTILDVPDRGVFDQLLSDDLPLGLRGTALERSLYRDVYFDTADGALGQRGVRCRFRTGADDRRTLSIAIEERAGPTTAAPTGGVRVYRADVPEVDPAEALRGNSDPARRLRGLVDPDRLRPAVELETERYRRRARHGWFPFWTIEVRYDVVTVRDGTESDVFYEVQVRSRGPGKTMRGPLVKAIQDRYAVRPTLSDKVTRGLQRALALKRTPPAAGSRRRRALAGEAREPRSGVAAAPAGPVPDAPSVLGRFINAELSWLEFNTRVLEVAEDPGTPLLARFRFLAIFSSNLDEFVMVRIGTLKLEAAHGITEQSLDGLTPQEQLDTIAARLPTLIARQQRCFRSILPDLERHGVGLRRWQELADGDREAMKNFFFEQIFPALTPQALTQAPGHPFPHITNLSVSLAVMIRDEEGGPVHFSHVRVPAGLPRFVLLPNSRDRVPIEDVISANLGSLYPDRNIVEVRPFRITRSGDIQVDEEHAANLLDAIEEEVKRRPFGAVVRLELDHAMPAAMRDLIVRELQFEEPEQHTLLTESDIYEVDGLIDLTAANELASLPLPQLDFPQFTPATVLEPAASIFELITQRDILVHHPYDSFESTTERFIVEAADDPDVIAIKMTLYRSGNQSHIIDALTRAAAAGKEVAVFVELKARFDEERNINWAKTLQRAGIHVVYGFVRLKTHAKTTLVVRREGDAIRRYSHIGTGNYNGATAKFYTDLGLLTCRNKLGVDLNDLFNELTGSSRPPQGKFRRLLVAPKRMCKRFVKLIEREAEHARAGDGGHMRVKLNGLADKEIIEALYDASQAGVQIDLVVRGICALRPGVPGLSERIRVFSILGRFLEHARIYHFANAGEPEYFIGSADWRHRNLRRRVEVVAPVIDPDACARLDRIFSLELDDPSAWQMNDDGTYARRPLPTGVDRLTAQEHWLNELTLDASPRDVL
ncbi:MAG: polyphosphate kinase 1 [Gemmatimonadetes bacterium]|nr:polyphosphate kinase 1 [Gemmatimonadota bacterium]